jgi:hypothetical protein
MKSVILLLTVVSVAFALNADPPINYALIQGWYNERATFYYNFGNNSAVVNGQVQPCNLYSLVTGFDANNNPIPVAGQHNIAPAVPGNPIYSDLWQIIFLTVPATYVANTVKDATVAVASFTTQTTGPLVNCPVVPIGSTLLGGGPNITLGWYQNTTINYFNFGPNQDFEIPIIVFPAIATQLHIVDQIPGQSGYSSFWAVNEYTAPSGYVPNTYKSFQDIAQANLGNPIVPGLVLNCPIISTDPVPSTTGSSTTGSSAATSLIPSVMLFSIVALMKLLF